MAIIGSYIILVGLFPMPIIHVIMDALKSFNIDAHHIPHVFSLEAFKSSAITLGLGTLLYIFFVRRVLYRKMGKKRIYINPTTHWFQLEENLYIQFFVICMHWVFIFQIIDKWVYIC